MQFDYVLAMDNQNLQDLKKIEPSEGRAKLDLFLSFSRQDNGVEEVPDPYYGGAQGFDRVLDLVESASDGLLQHICQQQGWAL